MNETLETIVLVNDEEERLEFKYCENVIEIYLNSASVCSINWSDNLKILFKRALELWGETDDR